jgi:o-succinylbenzoate---CoA ligase
MIVVAPTANPLQLPINNEQLPENNQLPTTSIAHEIIGNFQFIFFDNLLIIKYIKSIIGNQQETRNKEQETINFFSFVPLQILTILKAENNKQETKNKELLNQAKAIIIGGAPVSAELEALLQEVTAPVYSTYGMTETVSHIALKRLNGKEQSPYYQVLPNTQIGQDERNCLTIVSPVTCFEKIVTNDSVNLIDEKHFEWLGRVDNIINSGGVKIQVEKIENEIDKALLSLDITCRFVVLGLPDEKLGEALSLILETSENDTEKNTLLLKINTLINKNLTKYELPKAIYFLAKFPETATNKIDRLGVISLL